MSSLFEGMHGAVSLSLIAFSIVFLVLGGLTAVIYGIRFFVGHKSATVVPKAPAGKVPVSGGKSAPAVQAASSEGSAEEIVAAITGALIAKLGRGFRIVSVRPTDKASSASDGWTSWGRFEGMQGLDRSAWNTGGRR